MRIIIEMTQKEVSAFNCPKERISSWIWATLSGRAEPILPKGLTDLSPAALDAVNMTIDVDVELKVK